ncbi:flagellar hook-length control protein FliK [Luteibacter sp. UNC138MFCol5.1]|uniref:flagellar hook-length control protein FliK n=1 Tax=Luteibacter sp. UNC138MFCol5.1 TaxID=1502774 RepID=UPI0008C24788|nr:flagellar hook-length control protein FliK [Luteibacter sp. UNC138MFCol5.1]SEO66637.1 flagellar hook-length control protein FliK [Luteibacter sp. UNC138MFCol5.1]
MNNATLALQTAHAAAASPTPTGPRVQDDAAPSKRFDAALDAAHADARQTQHPSTATGTDKAAPPPKAPPAKDAAVDEKAADKKDDTAVTGDPSIAATMLSLIGVPVKVTEAATSVLGAVKGATAGPVDGALGATAALAALLPGDAAKPQNAEAGLLATAADAGGALAAAAVAPAATASPFDALMAAQASGAAIGKDDPGSAIDMANGSPMPLVHGQPMAHGAAPVVQMQATQAATSPQFAQELGDQIAWMGSGQVKEARIKLHPEELGSMDVRVNMDGGKVNVAIIAQHPAAVHAVQQTLSHLDTMLAHHGLSLGQADVGQRQAGQGADGQNGAAGQGGDIEGSAPDVVTTTRISPRGLVDEVA